VATVTVAKAAVVKKVCKPWSVTMARP
jgi:hypothetical protein